MTHKDRQSPQYAHSERDVAYLLARGWVKVDERPPEKKRPTLRLQKVKS